MPLGMSSEKNKDQISKQPDWSEELPRFRAEAAELLGVEKKKEEAKRH